VSNLVEAPDSIQPADISFSDLYSKAMSHPAGNDAAPASAPAVEAPTPELVSPAVVAPAATSPEAPAPALTPAEQKILDLPDDTVVRVKIDGKPEEVSFKEFKDGISREAVFTKRMQTLAEQRRDAEAQLAAQYAQIQAEAQALANAQKLFGEQFKQTLAPNVPGQPLTQTPPGAPTWDPGELATMGDVKATLAEQLEQIKAEQKAQQEQFVKALGQASQEVQAKAVLDRDAHTFSSNLEAVMAKPEFAALRKINPYADEVVRYKVAEMEPKSLQEALQFTEVYVKGWMDQVRSEMVESTKRQEVAKAQAKIEPPAGSPVPPAPQYKPGSFFGKDGKQNWEALRIRAESMLG
jgi:hypothetical protein